MIQDEILLKFESSLEEPPDPGTLTGDEFCSDLDGWSSLRALAFISAINQEYGIVLQPATVLASEKVSDIVAAVVARINAASILIQK
jgi:acyl carrier protein